MTFIDFKVRTWSEHEIFLNCRIKTTRSSIQGGKFHGKSITEFTEAAEQKLKTKIWTKKSRKNVSNW